jgi:glycine/D-amino acid oxidase-like deaminating enzyme
LHLAGKYIQIDGVMANRTDVWIRGGGVAGLTAAWHCHKAGLRVVLTDTGTIGSGASGAWWALMNPATGVNPTPVAGIRQAMVGFELMRNELGLDGVGWIRAGIWRPALDAALEKGFAKAAANPEWPAGWLRMDRPMHGLAGNGLLRVVAGYAVDMRLWLTAVAAWLGEQGVDIHEQVPPHHTVAATNQVDCVGTALLHDPAWAHLKLHPIKGQLREIVVDGIRGHYPALSARGYAIQTDSDRWIIGSTYEHDFTDSEPDAAYDAYLIDRFRALFPQPVSATVVGRWAGVRIGSHNRQPVLARHPEDGSRWAITGLGSKGLIYSQILGQDLANRLTNP